MAWTTPRTWVTGELVTAAQMNAHIKANEDALRAGGVAIGSQAIGDVIIATSTTQLGAVAAVAAGQVLTSAGTGTAPAYSAAPALTSVLLGDGTAGAPALAFTDDTDTGLRRASGNTVAVVTGGTDRAVFSSSGIVVADGTGLGFDASGYPGTLESQITRGGVGIIKLASIGNTNNEDLTIDLETTANTVAFGSSTGVTDYTFAASAAGVPFIVKVENTHNASASSDAVLNVNAGGTSGGDALVSFTGVGTSWSAGASNSDVKFHIANSATDLLTNTRLTIDGSGNVGIGTSSPSQVLELNSASGSNYLQFSTADAAKTYLGISSLADNPIVGMTAGDFGVRVQGGDFFVSTDSGSSGNLVVKNGGLVGLGTAAPQSLLDVRGAAGAPGVITVATDELTVVATDVLGSIRAQAPLTTAGTDAILVSAAIDFAASATFSASVNDTDIVFRTGESETATEKVRIAASGNVTMAGDLTVSGARGAGGLRFLQAADADSTSTLSSGPFTVTSGVQRLYVTWTGLTVTGDDELFALRLNSLATSTYEHAVWAFREDTATPSLYAGSAATRVRMHALAGYKPGNAAGEEITGHAWIDLDAATPLVYGETSFHNNTGLLTNARFTGEHTAITVSVVSLHTATAFDAGTITIYEEMRK